MSLNSLRHLFNPDQYMTGTDELCGFGDTVSDDTYNQRVLDSLRKITRHGKGDHFMGKKFKNRIRERDDNFAPPGMIFVRLGEVKDGDEFYQKESYKKGDVLMPRIVVDAEYNQDGEDKPVVLYKDPDKKGFLYMKSDTLVLVDEINILSTLAV